MRLSDCFTDMMAYTIILYKKNGTNTIPFDQARAHMNRLITESQTLCDNAHLPREDYELAKFAVFAWIDEIIMRSGWEGKTYWQTEQLQRIYFNTSDAGELFFQKMNTIGPHQNQVREVYYICLSLGFTGQYHNQGDEMLIEQLKLSNLKLLTGSSMDLPDLDRMQLFPEAYIKDHSTSPQMRSKGFSLINAAAFAAPVVVFGLLFIIYRFVLHNVGVTLISRIP